ncbi:translesion DNA synthesis-associated protein ImuA [Methylococcus geothermalis]|uniref:Translesion DNA synthesis-associated protein ImuA n=1 Tax=Methylococcus geothermalis TaxID=2681310 RepID=A0A858Q7G6_9GAMM|nr:translesion DNA synthesis-associated protein ImuA [Methylococcus geothermalis]QJD29656.1 translesion DNA synthesis-associated protein ImuA [Methylococcus geothermalis]
MAGKTDALADLLERDPRVWRGRRPESWRAPVIPSGHAALDAVLPGGGWPAGALTEIVAPVQGIGELRLLLPLMRRIAGDGRRLVWVAPPFEPYAPALVQAGVEIGRMLVVAVADRRRDLGWAMELLLRHPETGLVLAWPRTLPPAVWRRLQVAAAESGALGMLFSAGAACGTTAALRLNLGICEGGLELRILKARGGFGGARVRLML